MSDSAPEPRRWTRSEWATLLTLALLVQLGLICWLGQRDLPAPRSPAPASRLRLAGAGSSELLALADPTLFALPHASGFSGLAWMRPPQEPSAPFLWSEPPHWRELPPANPAAAFRWLAAASQPEVAQGLSLPAPDLRLPQISEREGLPSQSLLRLGGELAGRKLLAPLRLSAWPSADLLADSIVQVVISGDGLPVSWILRGSSGSKSADQQALEQARRARFEPVDASGDTAKHPACGDLIFQWSTLPMPSTNAVK